MSAQESDAVSHLTAPVVVSRADRGEVDRMLAEARPRPGRAVERALSEIERSTISGATIADVTADDNVAGTTPLAVASPFDPAIDASAPLLAVVGRDVPSPDRLTGVGCPTDLHAVADSYLPDRGALPSDEVIVAPDDLTVATSGLVVNVSSWALEVLQRTGRAAWFVDYLTAQVWRASEGWLAAQQTATIADLGAAFDAIEAPHTATTIAGPRPACSRSTCSHSTCSGSAWSRRRSWTRLVVIAPSAADVTYSAPMMLTIVEPERARIAISAI